MELPPIADAVTFLKVSHFENQWCDDDQRHKSLLIGSPKAESIPVLSAIRS